MTALPRFWGARLEYVLHIANMCGFVFAELTAKMMRDSITPNHNPELIQYSYSWTVKATDDLSGICCRAGVRRRFAKFTNDLEIERDLQTHQYKN